MKQFRVVLTVMLLFPAIASVSAESFRVRSMTPITIDIQKSEPQVAEIGYNDAVGIIMPKASPFLKGVEIEIKIPQDIIAYRNSMAYGVYRLPQPTPSERTIDYQAEQVTLQPLPSRLSFVLQIPVQKNHNLKTGPYSTVLSYVHDTARGPLVFRLLPIMKGLPENIEGLQFTVKVKPILTDEGGFRLKIDYPETNPKPVSVRIDEALVTNPESMQILAPGTHHLSIVSDDYRNEVRVFTVEGARITDLTVPLQGTVPRLFLVAPENASVVIDGQPAENARDPRSIEPGDHTILFKIGDYEIAKQITVEKGHDYTISMLIDINVTESQ
jgi:hypothetical protein